MKSVVISEPVLFISMYRWKCPSAENPVAGWWGEVQLRDGAQTHSLLWYTAHPGQRGKARRRRCCRCGNKHWWVEKMVIWVSAILVRSHNVLYSTPWYYLVVNVQVKGLHFALQVKTVLTSHPQGFLQPKVTWSAPFCILSQPTSASTKILSSSCSSWVLLVRALTASRVV